MYKRLFFPETELVIYIVNKGMKYKLSLNAEADIRINICIIVQKADDTNKTRVKPCSRLFRFLFELF